MFAKPLKNVKTSLKHSVASKKILMDFFFAALCSAAARHAPAAACSKELAKQSNITMVVVTANDHQIIKIMMINITMMIRTINCGYRDHYNHHGHRHR